MASTLVLTIVIPDAVQSFKDQLDTDPDTGAIVDPESIAKIARFIDGIANGSINATSVVITSIT